MAGRLEGKVAVITGGASGIGAGTVERFIAEGARCVIADIQVDAGAAFAQKFGNKAIFVKSDVANENEVEAVVAAPLPACGGGGVGGGGGDVPPPAPAESEPRADRTVPESPMHHLRLFGAGPKKHPLRSWW